MKEELSQQKLLAPFQDSIATLAGHCRRGLAEGAHLGTTHGDKRVVFEMCKHHRMRELYSQMPPAHLNRALQHIAQTTEDPSVEKRAGWVLARVAGTKLRSDRVAKARKEAAKLAKNQ